MSSAQTFGALQNLGFQSTEFGSQNLDLSDTASTVKWDVSLYTNGRLQIGTSGSSTAVVKLKWSLDGVTFYDFVPTIRRVGQGELRNVPLDGAKWLQATVFSLDAGAGDEATILFADQGELDPVEKILGQDRPSGTSAVSIYAPTRSGVVTGFMISNTGIGSPTCRVFLDADGTTYDGTTALIYDVPVPAGSFPLEDRGLRWPIENGGNLAVRTSVVDSLVFTFFGIEPE